MTYRKLIQTVALATLVCAPAFADPPVDLTAKPFVPSLTITAVPQGDGQVLDHHYQVYVPMKFRADSQEVTRAWDPSALPNNGMGLTGDNLACASDADCKAPFSCLNRADSGQIPVKLCALPPTH